MGRFILHNKIYDTDTAEKLCEWRKSWQPSIDFLGCKVYPVRDTTLYRTKRGNYFCVGRGGYDTLTAQLMTEAEAKQVLMVYNYKKYVELFGELEEG